MTDQTILREQLCRLIGAGDAGGVQGLLRDCARQGLDINAPCDPDAYVPASPLTLALRTNGPRMVALVLQQPGLDLNLSLPRYDTWLWVRSASLEVLRLVLTHAGTELDRADGNGKTALHEAVEDLSGTDKVDYLLSLGAAPDPKQNDGTTPLYRAALGGNKSAVDALLRYPVDVNNRNTDNLWTVPMAAVAEDHPEIVKKLLERPELDVNAQSDAMETALHIAADRGYVSSVKLLLERPDIKVNEKDRNGWTPLIKAAFADHIAVVKMLCEREDVALNFVDQDRQTALHWAVLAGNIDVVRLLLERPDVNVSLTNRPGMKTAFDLATEMHNDAIAELLRPRATAAEQRDELSSGDVYLPRPADGPRRVSTRPAIGDPPRRRS